MRRQLLILAVAAVMAAMMVVMAAPAIAKSTFLPSGPAGTFHVASKPSGEIPSGEIKNQHFIATYPTDPIFPTDPIRGPCSSGNNPNCVTGETD